MRYQDHTMSRWILSEVRMNTWPQRSSPASVTSPVAASTDLKRRRFLLALGAGGAGAAAVATQTLTAPVVATATAEAAVDGQGYRETEHVRDYYATTRI
jgi:hypothetical protein